MTLRVSGALLACALTLSAGAAMADPTPMSTPAMSGPLTANPNPTSFDSGLGTIYVTGVASGLALYQTDADHAAPGDTQTSFDLSNAQVSVQKTDGLVQFYLQAGEYSTPAVGSPYIRSSQFTSHSFGVLPVGYLKLQLSDTFSIEAGKLPTLIGDEYTFTTENMNIERGLLWYQEPAISRGVQANFASGPLSISVSLNDGYYSDRYNWISSLISYAFDSSNTLAFAYGSNLGSSGTSSYTAAPALNDGSIYNLLYTYTSAPLLISPYIQYQTVDRDTGAGVFASGSEWGFGVLGTYTLSEHWSLAGRAEYETSSGATSQLIYGPKSKAWSLTATPTWQNKLFFIRGELSYTGLSDQTVGFGTSGTKDGQFRALLETGIVF